MVLYPDPRDEGPAVYVLDVAFHVRGKFIGIAWDLTRL